ncbi:MAG: L-2-hydroxyglutarate oxidase [Aeromicrobium sp.]
MTERVGIIGAGIIGVALGRALAATRDAEVVVLEKERRVAAHQTGHNSGVVHAGVYYAPGSLKAALCSRGRELVRTYCQENNLPYRELGKIVVAVDHTELSRLDALEARSLANGVPGLRRLDAAQMREIEPAIHGVAALHSPHTAVVDYATIAESLADDLRQSGGHVLLDCEVTGIVQERGSVRVLTPAGDHLFDRVIACAGLQSDLVAVMAGAPASPRILPFRGEYWSLVPHAAALVRGLVYPVPDPRYPFLGVHFTRGVYDGVTVGPNAVPALAREGYRWRTVSPRHLWDSVSWPGAGPLAREHWRLGVRELGSSLSKRQYVRQARRFMPDLAPADLVSRSAAGVRAQAWDRDGTLVDDFVVDQIGLVTLVRNAPSPAATSALAIADHLIDTYL